MKTHNLGPARITGPDDIKRQALIVLHRLQKMPALVKAFFKGRTVRQSGRALSCRTPFRRRLAAQGTTGPRRKPFLAVVLPDDARCACVGANCTCGTRQCSRCARLPSHGPLRAPSASYWITSVPGLSRMHLRQYLFVFQGVWARRSPGDAAGGTT